MLAQLQLFLAKFQDLQIKLGSNPQNTAWRLKQDAALANLAADVVELAEQIERGLMHREGKFLTHCPPSFGPLYRLYTEKFRGHLLVPVQAIREERAAKLSDQLNEWFKADPESLLRALNDANQGAPFDIDRYDGAAAIDDAIEAAIFHLESWGDQEPFDEQCESAKTAKKAWRFLNDAIGIDIAAVFEKWKLLRPIFVPSHVSNYHGTTEENSLFSKLREACRAYACDCSLASIAMCRSILETTIERHYVIDVGRLPSKPGIMDKIDASSLSQIQKEQLKKLTKTANRVLHQDGSLDGDIEAQVSAFLFALKRLVEEAPVRTV